MTIPHGFVVRLTVSMGPVMECRRSGGPGDPVALGMSQQADSPSCLQGYLIRLNNFNVAGDENGAPDACLCCGLTSLPPRSKNPIHGLEMQYQLGALAILTASFVYACLRRRKGLLMIRDVPGPENPSWIFGMSTEGQPGPSTFPLEVDSIQCGNFQGHQWYLQTEEAGGAEKRFLENFGNTVHWNGPFGVRLAIYHIHASVLYS